MDNETPAIDERARAEALSELAEIARRSDAESGHVAADEVLMKLLRTIGYGDVAEAFDNLPKWYA